MAMRPLGMLGALGILSAVLGGSPVRADVIYPTVTGTLQDGRVLTRDNYYPMVEHVYLPTKQHLYAEDDKGVTEFKVANLPRFVTHALLTMPVHTANGPYPVRLQVFGYAGNGILDPIDFNAGTLVSSLNYSGEHQVTLDVTSFINNLRATEAGFAGFNFREPDAVPSTSDGFIAFTARENPFPWLSPDDQPPSLVVAQAATTPEPSSLILFLLGAVSFPAIRRLGRRQGALERS